MTSNGLIRLALLGVALVMLAFAPRPAAAEAPDPKSSDGQLMAPYGDVIRSLRQRNGAPCCSESDCRPAQYRTNVAGNYEVFISKLRKDGSAGQASFSTIWNCVLEVRILVSERRVLLLHAGNRHISRNTYLFCRKKTVY
jgi:hypothetical protein